MIEDAIEEAVEVLRGRRVTVDDRGVRWTGRLAGVTSTDAGPVLVLEHPDNPGAMAPPVRFGRESTLRATFAPASGPAGWRSPACLAVHAKDGSVTTVVEDDPAPRSAKATAPSTKQGEPPQRHTKEGAFAR
jgi:hypothetical protein